MRRFRLLLRAEVVVLYTTWVNPLRLLLFTSTVSYAWWKYGNIVGGYWRSEQCADITFRNNATTLLDGTCANSSNVVGALVTQASSSGTTNTSAPATTTSAKSAGIRSTKTDLLIVAFMGSALAFWLWAMDIWGFIEALLLQGSIHEVEKYTFDSKIPIKFLLNLRWPATTNNLSTAASASLLESLFFLCDQIVILVSYKSFV